MQNKKNQNGGVGIAEILLRKATNHEREGSSLEVESTEESSF